MFRSADRAPGFCVLRRGKACRLSPHLFLRQWLRSSAALRWCSGSSRNTVRLPFGKSVQLHQNPQSAAIRIFRLPRLARAASHGDNLLRTVEGRIRWQTRGDGRSVPHHCRAGYSAYGAAIERSPRPCARFSLWSGAHGRYRSEAAVNRRSQIWGPQSVRAKLRQQAVIVGVDLGFFRNRFWERLTVNTGIALVFAAFYLRLLRRP